MRIDLNFLPTNIQSSFSPTALQNMSAQTVRRIALASLTAFSLGVVMVVLIGRLRKILPSEDRLWLNQLLAALGNARAQLNVANLHLKEAKRQCTQTILNIANKGDAEACYQLGVKYEVGEDVEQNNARAIEFYQRAASMNHPEALYQLGLTYEFGNFDQEIDFSQAIELYKKAADLGHSDAQFSLGNHYADGWEGQRVDFRQAEALYLRAAGQNNAKAMGNLGWLYANENFNGYNLEKSRQWFARGAEQGDALSNHHMGKYAEEQDRLEDAKAFYKAAADLGKADSQVAYAELMEDEQDYQTAWKYYVKAGNQDYADAELVLSRFSKHGIWVEQSDERALTYLENAADDGAVHAYYKLAKVYARGQLGQERDISNAIEYATYAAHRDHKKAKVLLAQILPQYNPPVINASEDNNGSGSASGEVSGDEGDIDAEGVD